MNKPDSALRRAIRHGYEAGLPVKDIAALTGSTYGSVKVIAHNMGLKHPFARRHGYRGKMPTRSAA